MRRHRSIDVVLFFGMEYLKLAGHRAWQRGTDPKKELILSV